MEKPKQIEINHLAPYLPYDLQMLWLKNPTGKVLKVDMATLMQKTNWGHIFSDIEGYKLYTPILRPMDDLSAQIEFEGRKFTPIVELALIALEGIWNYRPDADIIEQNVVTDDHDHSCGCILQTKDDERIGFTLNFKDGYKEFQLSIGDSKNMMLDQFKLYEMLFKWHFDVFGLIDADLAIDANLHICSVYNGVIKFIKTKNEERYA